MNPKTLFLILTVTIFSPVFGSIESDFMMFVNSLDNVNKKTECLISNEDFIILSYQKILGKNPSGTELSTLLSMLDDSIFDDSSPKIKKSDILAILIARKYKTDEVTKRELKKEMYLINQFDICEKVLTTPLVNGDELFDTFDKSSDQSIINNQLGYAKHDENYHVYYGYLHAHTGFSDGEGTPKDAYLMARDEAKLDFFGVTDHDVNISIWFWNNEWKKNSEIADQYYEPGKFVTLRGFEWSSPIFGHISVLNSKKLINCIQKPTMKSLYGWLSRNNNDAFARFNHPGRTEFLGFGNRLEFNQLRVYSKAIKQMVGMELFNKNGGLRKFYYNTGYNGVYNFYDTANLNGWMVGAVGGQDNHGRTWGTLNDYRVGVYAKELTRAEIIKAYQERRTYATEDKNLILSFKMDSGQMGSRLHPGKMEVEISTTDSDGEETAEFHFYKNGKILKKIFPENNFVAFDIEVNSSEYYYVVALQQDGDLSISSPIWIK